MELSYEFKRSTRARHMRLSILPGKVQVVVPTAFSWEEAEAFVSKHMAWILEKQAVYATRDAHVDLAWPKDIITGAQLPLHGQCYPVEVICAKRWEIHFTPEAGFKILVPARYQSHEYIERKVIDWMKHRMYDHTIQKVEVFRETLGQAPSKIIIKKQKHLWGTCAPTGEIRLNRLLILAPVIALDYVIAHEMAHLLVRNHSKRFWQWVERLMPEYQVGKNWLKQNGLFLQMGGSSV